MHTTAGEVLTPGPTADLPRPGVWLTDASLVLMAVLWGVNFVVVKFATGLMLPLAFNAVRVSLAAIALTIIAAVGRSPWPSRVQVLSLLGLGVLGNGVYQVFFVEGVAHTGASDAAILVAATPASIAIIGRIRGVERIRKRGWAGILLSVTGVAFVSGAAAMTQSHASLVGDMLILCATVCWAFYTVLLKPHTHTVDGLKMAALTMMGGAVSLLLIGSTSIAATNWGAAPRAVWIAMAYSGVGALVIAYMFWYRGIRVIGPTKTAMYSNLQPIIAVGVAWIVLGEVPTVWQGVGAASIMSGLVLTRS